MASNAAPGYRPPLRQTPGDGMSDAAQNAVKNLKPGDRLEYRETLHPVRDVDTEANGGSLETTGDEIAAKANLALPEMGGVAPLTSTRSSGGWDAASASSNIRAAIAQDVTVLFVLAALVGAAAVAAWRYLDKTVGIGLGVVAASLLAFAFYPGASLWILAGGVALGVAFAIPGARKWLTERFALKAIVRHVESVSDKTNPDSFGAQFKRSMDETLDAGTLAKVDKAIDPLKGN